MSTLPLSLPSGTRVTVNPSFGFYLTPSDEAHLGLAASLSDAVTVAGKKGPEMVRRLRKQGFGGGGALRRDGLSGH